MKHFASLAVATLGVAFVPAAAHAQTAKPVHATLVEVQKGPTVGATIYDSTGTEVGTIESITDGVAVVFTGTNRASIPLTSFGKSVKGPTLGLTKVQLDEAAEQAKANQSAQLRSLLVPGADVHGTNGAVIAKVKEVDGDNVTLAAANGEARVPVSGVGSNAQGLFIAMTQAEFDAAVSAGAPAPQ